MKAECCDEGKFVIVHNEVGWHLRNRLTGIHFCPYCGKKLGLPERRKGERRMTTSTNLRSTQKFNQNGAALHMAKFTEPIS